MRTQLLIGIATVGLVVSAVVAAADSSQSALWTPRKLSQFSPPFTPDVPDSSCDRIIDRVRLVLLKFGARESDMQLDARRCYAGPGPSVDVSFSALAPAARTGNNATTATVDARWQTVQLSGDVENNAGLANCSYLRYVTMKVLPLFATRNVKLISLADCATVDVGLSAQVLIPTQRLVKSR
jgi:hypothetical protein